MLPKLKPKSRAKTPKLKPRSPKLDHHCTCTCTWSCSSTASSKASQQRWGTPPAPDKSHCATIMSLTKDHKTLNTPDIPGSLACPPFACRTVRLFVVLVCQQTTTYPSRTEIQKVSLYMSVTTPNRPSDRPVPPRLTRLTRQGRPCRANIADQPLSVPKALKLSPTATKRPKKCRSTT